MFLNAFCTFWKFHPALFFGVFLLLGCGLAFHAISLCILCFFLILFPLLINRKSPKAEKLLLLLGSIIIMATGFLYVKSLYPPVEISAPTKGTAYFSPQTLRKSKGPFSMSLSYEGKIKAFKSADGKLYYNLPARIYRSPWGRHPPANRDYIIEGTLIQRDAFSFQLKPKSWKGVPNTHSFTEKRYQMKQNLKAFMKKVYANETVFSFLSGLATGETEDRLIHFEFGQLGLSHLLAISGFHFVLLAFFFSLILRQIFSQKITSFCLILFMTFYYFYIGHVSSAGRAWMMILLILFGNFFVVKARPLNALGLALILAIILDPLNVTRLGFQLSFLATFALISFTPIVEKSLRILLPKRNFTDVKQMNLLNKQGYIFSTLTRKALAVNLSIFLFTSPLIFSYFYKYPLLSLIYNLFIPLGISLILFLMLIGLGLFLLHPLLGTPVNWLCTQISIFFLNQIEFYPKAFDFSLYCKFLSPQGSIFLLLPLMLFAILSSGRALDQKPLFT